MLCLASCQVHVVLCMQKALIEYTFLWYLVATTQKHAKYDPLINTIQNNGWKTNPLITITAELKGGYTRAHYQETKKQQNPKN